MHEIMFYNGFNLLIDLILIAGTAFVTYRLAWWDGYKRGIKDTKEGIHG